MSTIALEDWLQRYGRAWEARDSAAFSELFSVDAEYHWTPFRQPQRGREEIAPAVHTAFSGQSDVHFSFKILAGTTAPYVAHWTCDFMRNSSGKRVTINGIFVLLFDHEGQCKEFREWWHSDELENGSIATA